MEHVDRLLELFELTEQGDQPIRGYSSGQKKKIALSSALVTEAPVLLLDEPFSGGLDPAGILALKRVFQRHPRRKEMTIVLTSPVPEIVEEIASRIVVLKDGEVMAFDTVEGLRRSTGRHGSLGDVLEKLMFPETTDRLARYFQGAKDQVPVGGSFSMRDGFQ
jgi:ABC-2 type transport system ATP-binding protein